MMTNPRTDMMRKPMSADRPPVRAILVLLVAVLFAPTVLASGTLPYWIEPDADGNPSRVWVKVPHIPAGGSITLYAWKEAGYSPDGDAVFLAFDDFSTADKWALSGCNIDTDSKVMICNQPMDYGNYSVLNYSSIPMWDIIIGIRWKLSDTSRQHVGIDVGLDTAEAGGYDGDIQGNFYLIVPGSDGYYKVIKKSDSWITVRAISHSLPENVAVYSEIVMVSGGTVKYYEEGVLVDSHTHSDPLFDDGGYLAIRRWVGEIYYIFVRKYAENEPTVTVTDRGTYYEIVIENPNSQDLTDYQVAVPASELGVTSTTESIAFSDTPPFSVSITHSPTAQSDLALDPENNITSVAVDYNIAITKQNVAVNYYRVYDPDTNETIAEGTDDVNGLSVQRTYSAVGDYTTCVYVRATDDSGNIYENTACDTVHVDQYPQGLSVTSAAVSYDALSVTVEFNGTATDNGTIVSWEWDFGDGTTATGQTVSHAYTSAGTYTVTLTVTDDAGLSKTYATTVQIGKITIDARDAVTGIALSDYTVHVPELNQTLSVADSLVLWSPYFAPGTYSATLRRSGYLDENFQFTIPENNESVFTVHVNPVTSIIIRMFDEDNPSTQVKKFRVIFDGPAHFEANTDTGEIVVDPETDLNLQFGEYTVTVYPADANYPTNEYRQYFLNITREWMIENGANFYLNTYAVRSDLLVWQVFKVISTSGTAVQNIRVTAMRNINGVDTPVAQGVSQYDGTLVLPLSNIQLYTAEAEDPTKLIKVTQRFTSGVGTVYIVLKTQEYTILPPDVSLSITPLSGALQVPIPDNNEPVKVIDVRISSTTGSLLYIKYTFTVTEYNGEVVYQESNVFEGYPSGIAFSIYLDKNTVDMLFPLGPADPRRYYASLDLEYLHSSSASPRSIHATYYVLPKKIGAITENIGIFTNNLGPYGKLLLGIIIVLFAVALYVATGYPILGAFGLIAGVSLLIYAGAVSPLSGGFAILVVISAIILWRSGVLP